jgi:hypothetical protein
MFGADGVPYAVSTTLRHCEAQVKALQMPTPLSIAVMVSKYMMTKVNSEP